MELYAAAARSPSTVAASRRGLLRESDRLLRLPIDGRAARVAKFSEVDSAERRNLSRQLQIESERFVQLSCPTEFCEPKGIGRIRRIAFSSPLTAHQLIKAAKKREAGIWASATTPIFC